jgi:hypothetical protein
MNSLLLSAEQEQLDHQKARLESLLAADMVSPKTKSDLRRLVDDISRRIWELSQNTNCDAPFVRN